jgi:hypothetical protein
MLTAYLEAFIESFFWVYVKNASQRVIEEQEGKVMIVSIGKHVQFARALRSRPFVLVC